MAGRERHCRQTWRREKGRRVSNAMIAVLTGDEYGCRAVVLMKDRIAIENRDDRDGRMPRSRVHDDPKDGEMLIEAHISFSKSATHLSNLSSSLSP